MALEVVSLALMVVGLLDGVDFDPRKRLFSTAMSGALGQQLEGRFRALLADIGSLGSIRTDVDYKRLPLAGDVEELVSNLSSEVAGRGYSVGLPEPDRRHLVRISAASYPLERPGAPL